jgi:hypothetical protein
LHLTQNEQPEVLLRSAFLKTQTQRLLLNAEHYKTLSTFDSVITANYHRAVVNTEFHQPPRYVNSSIHCILNKNRSDK